MSDIVWHKPNPMPESVRDRPTKAHEYIFLLTKSEKYYYDAESIKEDSTDRTNHRPRKRDFVGKYSETKQNAFRHTTDKRNKRSVWTVTTKPFKGAHFATFPPDLIEPCILAGCPEYGTVLDPFFGSGTTGLVALQNLRSCIGIELNQAYIKIAEQRLKDIIWIL